MAKAAADGQELIHATALCTLLLETLERMENPVASEEFMAALRDFCERAGEELTALRAVTE